MEAPHPFYISTSEQSQAIDSSTIKEFGIDGFTLMEVAGYCAAQKLLQLLNVDSQGVFLCGKGNNAGDALVIARYLIQHGIGATVVFISGSDDLSEDTEKNLRLLKRIDKEDDSSVSLTILNSWNDFDPHIRANFIIDGMLGTGLKSEVRGDYRKAIDWANKVGSPTYAIDIPTGLHGDTGQIMGSSLQAGMTFSFGTLKQGFYLNEGPGQCGEIVYCELPFPNYLKSSCTSFLIDESYIEADKQKAARHKYEAGVLYIVAGSEGLTGAAILAAQSAWAEGIGAVILVCPHGNLPVYEETLPQIIKKPVGNRDDYFFKADHAEEVLSVLGERKGKVLAGPGIGRESDTISFIKQLVEQYNHDIIVDADGLWCLAQIEDWKKSSASSWIITPHPGELSTLLDVTIEDDHHRLKLVSEFAAKKNLTVVSKGFPVIIGTPDGDTYLTSYNTRKFSRAGFGDILAGKIGAYWSQSYSPIESSALALLKGKHILENLIKEDPARNIEPKDFI